MAVFKKHKLARAISLSLPLIASLTLSGCQDDDLNLDVINTPNSYEFSSERSASNPVNYSEATTALLLIDELEELIDSSYLQTYGQEHGYQATLSLLNRIYDSGTQQSRLDSLGNSNVYATETAESTPVNAINLSNELLNYSQLAPNVSLKRLSPGVEQPLHNRYSQNLDNPTSEEIGKFIGWNTGIPDGDLVFNTMIQDWLKVIAKLASNDNDDTTKFIENDINYKALIITTLKASIPYFQVSHNSLNQSVLADLASNDLDSLKALWDLGFGYSGMATQPNAKTFTSSADQWDSGAENLSDLKQNKITNIALFSLQADEGSPFVDTTYFKNLHSDFITGQSLLSLEQPHLDESETLSHLYSTSNRLIDTWEKALVAKLISHMNDAVDEGNLVRSTKKHHDAFINAWSNLKAYALALQFNPMSPISVEQLTEMHRDIGSYPPNINAIREFQSALIVDRFEDQAMRNILQNLYDFSTPNVESW